MANQMKKRRDRRRRIPEFSNLEEEAKFWDSHDTADYEHEFTKVQVKFAKNLSGNPTILLARES